RRVDVDLRGDQLGGVVDQLDLGVVGTGPLQRLLADVGGHDGGAVLEEVAGQVLADLAQAGDADPPATQGRRAPHVLGGGPHPLEHAVGGEHRRVAGAAVHLAAPGDVAGLAGDDVHVLHVRAHVTGGDVPAVQRLHEPAVRPQQRLGLDLFRVSPDHGLATTEVEPGQRTLVRHGAGQLQHVVDGLLLRRVGVETRTAQGGAQGGGVDADDRAQSGPLVLAEHDLLVAGLFGENAHVYSCQDI